MDITPRIPNGYFTVTGFGAGGYRFGDSVLAGPLLVLPKAVYELKGFDINVPQGLQAYAGFLTGTEILLLGTGKTLQFLPKFVRTQYKELYGATAECMDSAAACRTYNTLVGDDRLVAAVLLPL